MIFVVLSFGSALRESSTYDEPTHLMSGYLYWKTGHYTLNPMDPPLVPLWASLPLLMAPLHSSLPGPEETTPNRSYLPYYLLYENTWSPDAIISVGRLMMMVLAIGLGWLVWRWTGELWGQTAARASLIAYVFCPAMLGYGPLVICDFPHAVGCVFTLYAFWRWLQAPSFSRSLMVGLTFGLSVMAKFSGLLMILPMSILLLVKFWHHPLPRAKTVPMGLVGIGSAAAVVLLVYAFAGLPRLIDQGHSVHALLSVNVRHFFHGVVYSRSPHWFAAMCFLLKTPLPFLILSLAALIRFGNWKQGDDRAMWLWMVMPVAFYFIFLTLGHYVMGLRRELFVYPVLCMIIGRTVSALWNDSRVTRAGVIGLGVWYISSAAIAYPRYLSYFNETIPVAERHRWLVDCSLDWGQGLKELGRYLKKEKVSAIYLSYFGSMSPRDYGIHYISVDPNTNQNIARDNESMLDLSSQPKTLFAISATNLSGVYYLDPHLFDWLQDKTPCTIVMDSILVYDLSHDTGAQRRLSEWTLQPIAKR